MKKFTETGLSTLAADILIAALTWDVLTSTRIPRSAPLGPTKGAVAKRCLMLLIEQEQTGYTERHFISDMTPTLDNFQIVRILHELKKREKNT